MKHCLIIILFISGLRAGAQTTKYNAHYYIACHNCYEPKYAHAIEDVFPYTTTIEIDLWDTRKWFGIGGWKAMNGDWYVRHIPTEEGNINCCGGSFKDCLERINNWSVQHPGHPPVTVFIDKKENWSEPDETRKPEDLDRLLLHIFSKARIYAPADLQGRQSSLKKAALNDNWESWDSLQGKFIFVLTDGTEITSRSPLKEYLDARQQDAVCFVAPEITAETEIFHPKGFSDGNVQNTVFYNISYENHSLSGKISDLKCLSRVFNAPETREAYRSLVTGKANFIALHNYKLLQ